MAVIAQPDKPQGRKQTIIPCPVKVCAKKNNLTVFQPDNLSTDLIKKFKVDLGILASYGRLIKKEIIDCFPLGIINIHPSLLPKYRGPSPIQYALLNGEKITGVSLIKLVEKMDAGPILAQQSMKIQKSDNYQTLHAKLAKMGADLLINYLKSDRFVGPKENQQNEDKATFSHIIKKSDGEIKLTDDPKAIILKLKAYTPWPGIYFHWKKKRFKILKASINKNKLIIESIQPEGKRPMPYAEFIKGYKDFIFN